MLQPWRGKKSSFVLKSSALCTFPVLELQNREKGKGKKEWYYQGWEGSDSRLSHISADPHTPLHFSLLPPLLYNIGHFATSLLPYSLTKSSLLFFVNKNKIKNKPFLPYSWKGLEALPKKTSTQHLLFSDQFLGWESSAKSSHAYCSKWYHHH